MSLVRDRKLWVVHVHYAHQAPTCYFVGGDTNSKVPADALVFTTLDEAARAGILLQCWAQMNVAIPMLAMAERLRDFPDATMALLANAEDNPAPVVLALVQELLNRWKNEHDQVERERVMEALRKLGGPPDDPAKDIPF